MFAKYLVETDDGEFIAIENEGKTKPFFSANTTGKYRYLNCGVYVGELAGTPDAKDSVNIVIYKLR